jgi:hypothetical protein
MYMPEEVIALNNLSQLSLDNEERQESVDNRSTEALIRASNKSEEQLVICSFFILITVILTYIAYFAGKDSCNSKS